MTGPAGLSPAEAIDFSALPPAGAIIHACLFRHFGRLGRQPTGCEVAAAAQCVMVWLDHGGWCLADMEAGEIVGVRRDDLGGD